MGLDMYSYSINQSTQGQKSTPFLLHQWRKHPDLHGWMRHLYVKKGGTVKTKQNTLEDLEILTNVDFGCQHMLSQTGVLLRSIRAEISAHPTGDTFSRVPVHLTLADLDELDLAVATRSLPHTTGLFFGRSDGSEREDDLAFVEKARAALRDGCLVWYVSDW